MKIIGKVDKKSNAEAALLRLLSRHFEDAAFTIECQKKRMVSGRSFVVDFYIKELRTVLEVDGGLFMSRGGHNGKQRINDMNRDLLLMQLPIVDRVIRISPDNINLELVRTIKSLLIKYEKS